MSIGEDSAALAPRLRAARRVVALTGAGISAESGVPTFRGEEGLWRKYRAEDLATPTAFQRDPGLVWEWYDWRRGLMAAKRPNPGHEVLAGWESRFPEFLLITQNIDGLHRLAGSERVLELHGSIWTTRCTAEGTLRENRETPLADIPPLCPACGALLRPHVVWFGESLDPDIIHTAFEKSRSCDLMVVAGTSAVVQPAASLPMTAAQAGAFIVEINPDETPLTPYADVSLRGPSGVVLPALEAALRQAGTGKD